MRLPNRSPLAVGPPRRRGRLLRWVLAVGVAGALAVAAAVGGSVAWIRHAADGRVYDAAAVPAAPVALVLGAQVNPDGSPSGFLAARLAVAADLYARGRVGAVLVSGDHGGWAYDEPGAMAWWLTSRGVPADRVVQDHAGFDTYDSCQRASRVFGVRSAVVVTQSFHLERAVALCAHAGIEATGVGDDTARQYPRQWRWGAMREYGAAVKAAADVLSGRDPIFLGPRETALNPTTP
ncbi:SanA/YdcF family protein [Pilimelia anulata]|uniref:SanA/YdcF family protein n=1 Tax=Pilimelia anulata TaxID=53371 RepID=UPI0035711342